VHRDRRSRWKEREKLLIKQIRITQPAKDQLSRLKAKTGLVHWNVLCRWAFCVSIAEPTQPPAMNLGVDSNVELSWQVFAGEYHELYHALIIQRCLDDGLDPSDPATVNEQFRLHLHRGIAHLSATNFIRSIGDLTSLIQI